MNKTLRFILLIAALSIISSCKHEKVIIQEVKKEEVIVKKKRYICTKDCEYIIDSLSNINK